MPKEIEKAEVGRVWAANTAGRGVFAMLYKQERGMNLAQQLDSAIAPAGGIVSVGSLVSPH